jgi:hypothetical protein
MATAWTFFGRATVHLVVYDADEQEHFLEAVCGFALPLVSAVEWDVESHDAPLAPPSHPFVALAGEPAPTR